VNRFACGTENRIGRKFCSSCGAALVSACTSCGAANEPPHLFCGECGTKLTSDAGPTCDGSSSRPAPVPERKHVSMLFADLVGFTSLSESRDPEEVPTPWQERLAKVEPDLARA
jgi:hypothetical protein